MFRVIIACLLFCFLSLEAWADVGFQAKSHKSCAASLRRIVVKNTFTRHRGLDQYLTLLGRTFARRFLTLGKDHHWIDMGAGNAQAARHYLSDIAFRDYLSYEQQMPTGVLQEMIRRLRADRLSRLEREIYDYVRDQEFAKEDSLLEKATVTAISYKIDFFSNPLRQLKKKLRIFRGRFFEAISNREILQGVSPADMITDGFGIFAYSARPDKVLARYVQLVKSEGVILIWWGRTTRPEHMRYHMVRKSNGRLIPLIEWVQSIPGLRVRYEHSRLFSLPQSDTAVIEVVDREAVVIPRLRLIQLIRKVGREELTLPRRIFEEVP